MNLNRAILLITTALLFLATLSALSLPYGYFIFLRVVVCGVAIYTAIQVWDSIAPAIALLLVAVVFNPFVPIHFPETTWRIIDLATAGYFLRLVIKPSTVQKQR